MQKIFFSIRLLFRIIGNAVARFYFEDGFSRAAALAYSTLLALVPIAALSISFLSTFGIGHEQALSAIRDILEKVLPSGEHALVTDLQKEVFGFLEVLNKNVSELNTLTILVLVVTSVFLLITIQTALNDVWRVSSEASLVTKILNYWAVITLAFLLIAVSIFWTTKVRSLPEWHPVLQAQWWGTVNLMLPTAVSWLALSMLFYRMPSAPVAFRNAAFGGLLAAVLFELLKTGFAYYLGQSTTYSTLYGVLASIPLFLFWLYLIWVVILIGAHASYQAGSIHVWRGMRKYATDLGEVGATLGLQILAVIGKDFIAGKQPPSEGDVAIEIGSDPVLVRSCLDVLTEVGILTEPDRRTHARTLKMAPEKILVRDVASTFLSKRYRNEASEDEELSIPFLEHLRDEIRARNNPKPLSQWTLVEVIGKPKEPA